MTFDPRRPNAAFNELEADRARRESIPPTPEQIKKWEAERLERLKKAGRVDGDLLDKGERARANVEAARFKAEQEAILKANLLRDERASNEWLSRDPDAWSEKFRMEKIMAWRKRYSNYSNMDLYELLLKDEGYWYEVNGFIQNLPPEPDKVKSSVEETFYTYTVPYAGVRVDWFNDSTVGLGYRLNINGEMVNASRGNSDGQGASIQIVYRERHARPQGMGVELAYLKSRHTFRGAVTSLTSPGFLMMAVVALMSIATIALSVK